MHEKNVETLRNEAQRLLLLEIKLLERMQKEPGIVAEARDGAKQTLDQREVNNSIAVLRGEMAKLESLEVVLAVVGTMKAGKSTTINAIVGTEILPNRNRPMTALPTLIRHTPGQTEPLLKFDNHQPINDLMSKLYKVVKGSKTQTLLQQIGNPEDMEDLLSNITSKIQFKSSYRGRKAIFDFLKSLNDLVRLSTALKIEFPFASYREIRQIPVIEVEFFHLRELGETKGRLTLLDTPGPNEAGQPHLRSMLTEQLQKASAVLAVLDFTQLKSEAEAEMRSELKNIDSVSDDRLYALVNKFDQKNRNSDNEDQTKSYVSDILLQGLIKKTNVFPVSSGRAYLANRTRHELFLNKKLPSTNGNDWVSDFANLAFGECWDTNDLKNVEKLEKSAEIVWRKSLFQTPLEKIIQQAHKQAAGIAIDSAAAKIIENSEKISNFLGIRKASLGKDLNHIQAQIENLSEDITRIKEAKQNAQKKSELALRRTGKATKDFFEKTRFEIDLAIKKYFKEGKQIEWEQAEEGKKSLPLKNLTSLDEGIINSLFRSRKKIKESAHKDFNPQNPVIKFNNRADAEHLLNRIDNTIRSELNSAEKSIQAALENILTEFRSEFSRQILDDTQRIINDIKERMSGDGFSVEISIPNIAPVKIDFSAKQLIEKSIEEKNEPQNHRRRASGIWGTVCSWFDTDDWGWESYQTTQKVFEIDINSVHSNVSKGLDLTFSTLNESVIKNIEIPLQERASEFFSILNSTIEDIQSSLQQSIEDQRGSKSQQEALALRLEQLIEKLPAIQRDSKDLKGDAASLKEPTRQEQA